MAKKITPIKNTCVSGVFDRALDDFSRQVPGWGRRLIRATWDGLAKKKKKHWCRTRPSQVSRDLLASFKDILESE